jgi:hypothetical protein
LERDFFSGDEIVFRFYRRLKLKVSFRNSNHIAG